METETGDEMRTVRQWSLLTSIPYSTLRNAVRDGHLPAMRFTPRGGIYVMKSDMDQFIATAKVRATEEE